ncbi:MAG: hypothetical protein ACRC5A_02790, partial [Enterobacteriaceae bacterium]
KYSISDAPGNDNRFYRGELTDREVFGSSLTQKIDQQQIEQALSENQQRLTLKAGERVMLIQSGAQIPDPEMEAALNRYYQVVPYTGVPASRCRAGYSCNELDRASDDAQQDNYSKVLRLTAARGGIEKILVYWGTLETGQQDLTTKKISWVPIVGNVIPDESQLMRIVLRIGLIDVKSGQWQTIMVQPFDSNVISSESNRLSKTRTQVEELKDKAYLQAATEINKQFAP